MDLKKHLSKKERFIIVVDIHNEDNGKYYLVGYSGDWSDLDNRVNYTFVHSANKSEAQSFTKAGACKIVRFLRGDYKDYSFSLELIEG